MRVEEHDRLETRELGVVHLDGFEGGDELVHDTDADVAHHGVLRLRHPDPGPLADVAGDDHVVAEQQDVVEVHGPPGQPQQQVLASVGPQQRNLATRIISI